MTAGSSTTFADLLAEWGHDPSCSSKTCQGCLLQTTGTLWPESFTAWPASATASPGGLFQQPPLEPHTDGVDGGPLLSTPTAWLGRRPSNSKIEPGVTANQGQELTRDLYQLLPTPTASDHKASGGSTVSNVTLTDAMVRGHGHAPPCSEGTGRRLPGGNASSVDQHQLQLSTDNSRHTSSSG